MEMAFDIMINRGNLKMRKDMRIKELNKKMCKISWNKVLIIGIMSGTLKTTPFKVWSFPSIPKNFPVEEKSPIKPLAEARGRRFFGKFFLILLIFVSLIILVSSQNQSLEEELAGVESELSSQGYDWLMNYSLDLETESKISASQQASAVGV